MRLFTTIVVILCAAGMAFAQTPGTGKVTQLQYPRYGFALHLPSASDKQTVAIPPGQDMFAEAFTGGGMVYAVFVASEKDGVPPAVMLEQTLAMMSMQAPQAAVRRWQANSGQGIVFNGFTFTIPKAAVAMAQEAWIKQAIGSGDGVQAGAISPLPGNSKYAVGVAAMGPKTRESQVDDAVRMMISSLSFPGYNPGAPSAGAPAGARAQPSQGSGIAWPALKAGEIALAGVIDTVAADKTRMNLLADQVLTFGQKPAKLSPARAKTVLSKALPAFAKPGTRVIVSGKNEGQGKPLTADAVKLASAP